MSERKAKRAKMRELLLFIPNLLGLLLGLLKDSRVSKSDKAILAGIIMYVIVPLDVIPDFVPFIGQVDDAYLLAISILRLLNRADRRVVMDHWRGGSDIKELVDSISKIAEFFLPPRVKNVLRGRIEPKGRFNVMVDEPAGIGSR
ncbi:MAG TPA: YkvA family protein [Blastocatellia bacterium]|nr:YkvA family protein [Blastocatellia bacterium]